MDYQYIGYTQDKKLVKGKLTAATKEAALNQLNYIGYQVLNLKTASPLLKLQKILSFSFTPLVQPKEVIMFSRQLALLIESGVDIVTALDLLDSQTTNRNLKKILNNIVTDLRNGSSFSAALSKYPGVFSSMYHHSIAAGEQGGNLDVVLRRMADYMERVAVANKKVKAALTYPIIVVVVAIVVATVIVVFVLPTFTALYKSLGAELPAVSRLLIGIADLATAYGLYAILVLIIGVIALLAYIRTPGGREFWDRLTLRSPVVGHIIQLNELSRCCRTMAMLVNIRLPIPDILTLCADSSGNKVVAQAINEVRQEAIRGENLSGPMAKRPVFLPLMVQMVAVGEETGNLGKTLTTVAESYEADADERTMAAVGLLQPALTIAMALVVGFVAVAMVSAMYGIYGQFSG